MLRVPMREAQSVRRCRLRDRWRIAPLEVGIDLSTVQPVALTGRMLTELNFLVTLGCAERCPTIPLSRRQDWRPGDPKGQSLEAVRAIRDAIRELVIELIQEKGWGRDERVRPQLVPIHPS